MNYEPVATVMWWLAGLGCCLAGLLSGCLAGCWLGSPKVLPHRIGSKTFKFAICLIEIDHEVDRHNFMKFVIHFPAPICEGTTIRAQHVGKP